MAARALHIVSSIGDVTDRASWSGTPFAIWSAIRRRRPDTITHDIMFGYRAQHMIGWGNALLGLGTHNPTRVGIGYALSRSRAGRIAAAVGAEADFVHFGSAHLPVRRIPGQRHFLFTDSSAFLMTANPAYQALSNARHRAAVKAHEQALVADIDGLFVTADYVADAFIRRYGLPAGKVMAVGSGLGRTIPDPGGKDHSGGYMLFVAKQNFVNKGGVLLLDAFDRVRMARSDARLVVIGNDADPAQADHLARMRATPGLVFHNWDTPDYQALVAGAALYAGPAPDEPWGLIYLESLAVRTPILGLAANAFPQFVQGGAHGFTASAATPDAVAATMLEALSDPIRLAAMGASGRAHVLATYDWDRIAGAILARIDAEDRE